MRSTVSNNLVLPSSSRLDRSSDSSVPVRCHGPLCKSYICYIDTLPIGHSVLIQLKANLRLRYFQSVNANHIELILEDFSIFFPLFRNSIVQNHFLSSRMPVHKCEKSH